MSAPRRASALRASLLTATLLVLAGCESADRGYPDRVEIRRTSFGVPHILGEDLGAMAYGLAWVHMEGEHDYPITVVTEDDLFRVSQRTDLSSDHFLASLSYKF